MTELALAQSLTGVLAHDGPILATLVSDVQSGIQLNYRNLANVGFPPLLLMGSRDCAECADGFIGYRGMRSGLFFS